MGEIDDFSLATADILWSVRTMNFDFLGKGRLLRLSLLR
jgi:hypothetical protein